MSMLRALAATCCACAFGALVAPARADVSSTAIFDRPRDGILVEGCFATLCRATVWLTDAQKVRIPAQSFPRKQEFAGRLRSVAFNIPAMTQIVPTDPVVIVPVVDVEQQLDIIADSGESANLSIESLGFDPATGRYFLNNLFGTIARRIGDEIAIPIPDVFADTNRDGALGPGDFLYSVVDLETYLNAIPSFSLGDTISIVNGATAGFPGMAFSTTPITFDSLSGFSFTPWTGNGLIGGRHEATTVPEPASLVLVAAGLGFWAARQRRAART